MGKRRTPVHVDRTSGTGSGPLCVGSRLPTVGSKDSRAKDTEALLRQGSGADMCPGPAWCGPVHITLLLPAQAGTRCCHMAYHM
jgi:hypothetical protein